MHVLCGPDGRGRQSVQAEQIEIAPLPCAYHRMFCSITCITGWRETVARPRCQLGGREVTSLSHSTGAFRALAYSACRASI
jgi:hypothetical protein